MRTCVRCAAGWMYCALFCFSRLSLFFLLGRRTEGEYKFARSRLRFVLLWVFVSSGTDCRVRRRMHAPFPGPYVSTNTLALNFNPTLHLSCFLLTLLQSSSFSLSLSLFVSKASARYSRGHTAIKSWNVTCPFTKDKPMSLTHIHKFLFVRLSEHRITSQEL